MGELFKRYTNLVFAVCMKYLKNVEEAREAVMQIFEKLFTDLLKHKVENFKPWVHTVAKNHCLLIIRAGTYQLKKEKELKKNYSGFVESHDELYPINEEEKEEMYKKLDVAITQLNEEQRACIELFYLQEKCYDEVSKITGYSMNQVKSYIQNGKRNLKIFLQNNNGR